MRWPRRNITIAVSAAAAIGLVASLVAVLLPRSDTPGKPPPTGSRQLYSPFTGEPVAALGPVLAVKIDNLAAARPQTGLSSADIVYVLPVEGGLSRFLTVFFSHFPPVVGPVRSAREDDLELLRQFGRPAFAYSGAQPQLLPVVEKARTIGTCHRGRSTGRAHRGDPVHEGADFAVPRGRSPAAVRGEHRYRDRRGAARRARLRDQLVTV